MALMALRAVELNLAGIDHRMAGGVGQHLAVLALLEQGVGHAHLAGDDHPVGGRQRLAGDAHLRRIHAGLLGLAEHQVDDLVRDSVADLVRMPLGNRFGGEEIGRCAPRSKPLKIAPKCEKSPGWASFCHSDRCRSSEYKESFMSRGARDGKSMPGGSARATNSTAPAAAQHPARHRNGQCQKRDEQGLPRRAVRRGPRRSPRPPARPAGR